MNSISKKTVAGIKILSITLPILTCLILLATFFYPSPSIDPWLRVGTLKANAMAWYGLSQVITISMMIAHSSMPHKKSYAFLCTFLLVLGTLVNPVASIAIAVTLSVILFTYNRLICHDDHSERILSYVMVGVISLLSVELAICWTCSLGYLLAIETLVLIAGVYVLGSIVYLLTRKQIPEFVNSLFQ